MNEENAGRVSEERLRELYWYSPETMMDGLMRMDLRKAISELLDRRANEDVPSQSAQIGAAMNVFMAWVNQGPTLARAAGVYVGIKIYASEDAARSIGDIQ